MKSQRSDAQCGKSARKNNSSIIPILEIWNKVSIEIARKKPTYYFNIMRYRTSNVTQIFENYVYSGNFKELILELHLGIFQNHY